VSSTDSELARDLATVSGELLLSLRHELGFSDPTLLRKSGDRRSHLQLMALLADERPDDIVLSEEAADDRRRMAADRVWIIDPLDGTNEYGEEGRTDWAVHVALWERGSGLTAGAVALPARGMTLSTADPLPLLTSPASSPRLAVSRSRPPSWIADVAARVSGVPTPIGSAGMKAMAILLGEADAYLHRGPMKEWDSAAPVVVAAAAGLHTSALDGLALEYNKSDRFTHQLLICHPSLTDALVEAASHTA
jgi:3'(2'), 5'-bisphosphate nucleotidase